MKSIYDYSDYRRFLKDFLDHKKSEGKPLTYEDLGKAVGFTSKGFVTQILQGKSKIPIKAISKFSEALKLKKKESEYFETLVHFNQATSHKKRKETFEFLTDKFSTQIKTLTPDKYDLYKKWYYTAIRSLLAYHPFQGDYEELARCITPQITIGQAKKAIKLLEKLQLIVKKEDGFFHLVDRVISVGREVQSVAITSFQQETMELAKEALERFPKPERHSATLTLGLSEDGYKAVEEKLNQMRKEIIQIAKFDKGIDRVTQVNIHAFPLAQKKGKKEK